MITGESQPVRRGTGDHVVAGTVATDSGLRVEITAVGDDTALAGIQRLVARGAELDLAGAAARRPRRRLAVLVRARSPASSPPSSWTLLGLPDQRSCAPSPCW